MRLQEVVAFLSPLFVYNLSGSCVFLGALLVTGLVPSLWRQQQP